MGLAIKNPKSKKRTVDLLIASLVTVFACVALFLFLLGCPRITNDQVLMRDIVSGVYTGKPDGHTVFIMYPLGFLLSVLYSFCKVIPWYDVVAFLAFPMSLFFFLYYGNGKFSSWVGKLMFTLAGTCMFFMPDLFFLIQNEFDVNAGILSVSAVFCLVCCEKDDKISRYIPSIILFLFSLWIRREVLYMMLPVTAVVVLWKLIFEKDKRIYRPVVIIGALVFASLIADAIAYSSPEWKNFSKYNVARSEIVDYGGIPPYETVKDIVDKYDVSEDEYIAFSNGMGLCEKIGFEAMVEIAEIGKNLKNETYRTSPEAWKNNLIYSIRLEYVRVKNNAVGRLMIVLSVLLVAVSLGNCILKKSPQELFCLLPWVLTFGYTAVFAVYFIYKGRYPEKISLPLYNSVTVVVLGLLIGQMKKFYELSKKKAWPIVAGVFATAFVLMASGFGIRETAENIKSTSTFRIDCINKTSYVELYCNDNPSSVYYIDNGISNYKNDYLFKHAFETAPNSITLGYWTLCSPLFDVRKAQNGLTYLADDLLIKENAYFIADKSTEVSWLHSLNPDTVEIVDEFDDGVHFINVYSLRK